MLAIRHLNRVRNYNALRHMVPAGLDIGNQFFRQYREKFEHDQQLRKKRRRQATLEHNRFLGRAVAMTAMF